MENDDVRRRIWLNTIASYLRMLGGLVIGMFMFRLLWNGLDEEHFGFWILLWSFIGYGTLMDFGLGKAVEKKVAELSATNDWEQLSRVLSTVFTFYLLIAVVICAAAWPLAAVAMKMFIINPINVDYFHGIMVIFICFIGLSFPMGIFGGVIYGLQRMFFYNIVSIIVQVTNLVLIALAVHHHFGLRVFFLISLTCMLAPNLIVSIAAMRALPKVRITPRLFSWIIVRQTMRFAIFAYLTTLTNIILNQTDRFVIGSVLGVARVPVYQVGAKVADIFGNFIWQIPTALEPAAAYLHAKKERDTLRELFTGSCRVNAMIATPLYLLCAMYAEGVFAILTKHHNLGPEVFWTAQVLLFWGYTSCLTHGVTKPVFLMCGHERRLALLSIIEAIANLVLSLVLVHIFRKVFAVAVGSLIPSVIIGWGFLWRWAARDAGIRSIELVRNVLLRTWLANLPLLAFCFVCRWQPWDEFDFRLHTPWFLAESGVAAIIAVFFTWQRAMKPEERDRVLAKLSDLFAKARGMAGATSDKSGS